MRMTTLRALITGTLLPLIPLSAQAPAARTVGSDIAAATRNLERRDGFIPVYLDAEDRKSVV